MSRTTRDPVDGAPPDRETLAECSDAVCRMGAMMLAAGTGSYRVKLAMGRVADALGIDTLEAQVSLTEIVVTARRGGEFRTQVVEAPTPQVDADRIAELMRVSLRADADLTAGRLQAELDEVTRRPHLYPVAVVALAAAVACAAFAFLNDTRWPECVGAGCAAAIGKYVQIRARRFRINPLAVVAIAAACSCGSYTLFVSLMRAVGSATFPLHEVAVISATLFLVPGFPLLTAALDLARFDFTAGVSRLIFAALVTGAAAVGIWVVARGLAVPSGDEARWALAAPLLFLLRCVASLAGVLGFAVTFNTPVRVALVASVIGAVANVARLTAVDHGWAPLFCAATATTLIGLLAGSVNQRLLAPRITLSVPAVLIMVPGASTYRGLLAMMSNDSTDALVYGLRSLSTVGALAIGLVVARMLTDPAWAVSSPVWTRPPRTRAQTTLRRR